MGAEESFDALLSQGRFQEAVIRMECALLEGRALPEPTLRRIPGTYVEASPLLLQAAAELAYGGGMLAEARQSLEAAVKGFAAMSLPDRLIGAMCTLAELQLRMGDIDAAETLLLFLKQEYDKRRGDDGDGRLPRVLAAGARFIDSESKAKDWYATAIRHYERERRLAEASYALVQLIDQCGEAIQEHEWRDLEWRIRQWSAAADNGGSRFEWVGALWDLRRGRRKEAVASLREFMAEGHDSRLPYYVSASLQIAVYRAMLGLNAEEALRSLEALRALQKKHRADLLLQYALLQAMADGLVLAGETREAEEAAAELDRLARHLKLPKPAAGTASAAMQVQDAPARKAPEEAPQSVWRIRLFGGLTFWNGSREVRGLRWKRKKAQELYIYLLLQPNYTSTRDQLIELLQLGESPDKSAQLLYVITHQLRQTLQRELGIPEGVSIREGLVSLREDAIEYVDIERYFALLRVADQLWTRDRTLASELYEEAFALYDELLPELPYVSWLANMREHALDKQSAVVRKLCLHAAERQDPIVEEHYCREWIRLRPEQEEAYQQLLRLLARTKRYLEAKQLYERFAQACRDEFGTEPSAETALLLGG